MEINGIAHIMLTVSDFDACRPFYEKLLAYFGLTPVIDGDGFYFDRPATPTEDRVLR